MSEATKRVIEYLHKENEELKAKCDLLEKALDKACEILENLDKRGLHYEEKWLRSIGCEDEVQRALSKDEWMDCVMEL